MYRGLGDRVHQGGIMESKTGTTGLIAVIFGLDRVQGSGFIPFRVYARRRL